MNANTISNSTSEETKEHVNAILDRLISVNRDAVEGYTKAADLVDDDLYRQICKEGAEQRERFITELTNMMGEYGGTSTDLQSIAGILHETWMNIRDMVSKGDGPVLAECERGESVAVELYQDSINENLPENVDTLLRSHFSLLKGMHQRIERLSSALN